MIRLVATLAASFLVGTALHEATHWAVARGFGADIREVRLLPPSPRVVYRPPSDAIDQTIRSATVAASLPLAVTVGLLLPELPRLGQAAALVGLVGYLPRSRSDWAPLAAWFKRNASQ